MADSQYKVFVVDVSFSMFVVAKNRVEAERVADDHAADELGNGCANFSAAEAKPERFAREVEAFDAEQAAEEYAGEDSDGCSDGLYSRGIGQPICVKHADGKVEVFAVKAEYEPTFYATPWVGEVPR